MIGGFVEPGFEEVQEQFVANFERRGELGAACAAYHGGVRVVDLWGGYRDIGRREPWRQDTLVMVYSTSKGLAAMAVAVAHSRGWLDYEATVASYWPQFAQNGKDRITVRQLLSHQAGLCAIDERLDAEKLANLDAVAEAIARQRPAWKPGTRQGYHALSLGWYEGELIRRVDPQHRSLGKFFADEIAAPLELEFYFGLPPSVGPDRVASIAGTTAVGALLHPRGMPLRMLTAFLRPSSLTARVFGNPKLSGTAGLDAPEYRAVENPAGGGIGQPRSVAKAYGELATGGTRLGLSAETMAELIAPPRPPSQPGRDLVLMADASFSLGFSRPSNGFRFGSSGRALGHPGAGGSFAFADPDLELSFAYAPNRLGHLCVTIPGRRPCARRSTAVFGVWKRDAARRPRPERIRAMRITLVRHATLLVELAAGTLLIDPMLDPAGAKPPIENTANTLRNPMVELPFDPVPGIDAVLVTHLHEDHFDDTAAERLPRNVPVFCQPEDEQTLKRHGLQTVAVTDSVDWRGLTVHRTGGFHGLDELGPVSGFVLDGLYIAGDTVWHREVEDAIERHRPRVAILFAGAARFVEGPLITMGADDVAQVARRVETVIAVHMEAINHCGLTRSQLRETVEGVLIPADGETLVL